MGAEKRALNSLLPQVKLPAQKEVVTSDELMAYLGKEPRHGWHLSTPGQGGGHYPPSSIGKASPSVPPFFSPLHNDPVR